MACGCNKNKKSSVATSRGPAIRPGVYNRAAAAKITPAVQAQVRSQAIPAAPKPSPSGMNAEKRKVQALRRNALLKAKGK